MQHTLETLNLLHAGVLAEAFTLVAWWKALVLLVPFIAWGWFISAVCDKHATTYHLDNQKWNTIHMVVGLVALVVALVIPGEAAFFIALPAVIVLLVADIAVFVVMANRDERVPEHKHLRFNAKSLKSKADSKKASKKQTKGSELGIRRPDKSTVAVPDRDSPEYEVRVQAEQLVLRARAARATQLDILPTGKDNSYAATFLVDGVRQPGETFPAPAAAALIDFWKSAGNLDVNDRRRKLAADLNIVQFEHPTPIRLTTSGSQAGMRLSILFEPKDQVRREVGDLGLLDAQREALDAMVDTNGIVLLAAPPDGGRTTLLYTVIKLHDAYTRNVQTVEIDVQDTIEGVKQTAFDPSAEGQEYSKLVRSILRRDPDVVGVAELPDGDTAKEAAAADHDRTRTYISMRADSALSALQLYIKAVGDPKEAAAGLRGIVAQRLVRKLCTNCRVPYTPQPDTLKKLGLPADKVSQLYKKGGQVLIKNKPEVCPACGGVGYVGQEGILEVYDISQTDRALIAEGNLTALRAELRKKRLPSIQQAALKKAAEGVTSVEEVLRVTAEQPKQSRKKPAAQQGAKPATNRA